MELDTKQKVLVAIYTEYQKDIPEMNNVNHVNLEMDEQVFVIALEKLVNENLITDFFQFMGGDYDLSSTKMTNYGLRYVEDKLNISTTLSGSEKVKEIGKKATEFGWNELKDFAAKVLAELMKG